MRHRAVLPLALLTLAFAAPSRGAEDGYLEEFLGDFDRVSQRLLDLAEATQAEAFSWRPTVDVRSVSEVYMHVAGANFYLARDLGVPFPADLPEDLEKQVTSKDQVVELLRRSQEQVRTAVAAEKDLNRQLHVFGRDRSARNVYMIVVGHSHEHLGQSIAYARMRGVVPPWSRQG